MNNDPYEWAKDAHRQRPPTTAIILTAIFIWLGFMIAVAFVVIHFLRKWW